MRFLCGSICAAGEFFGFFACHCSKIAFLDLSNGCPHGKIPFIDLPKHFVNIPEPVEQQIRIKHRKNTPKSPQSPQISQKIEKSCSCIADIAKRSPTKKIGFIQAVCLNKFRTEIDNLVRILLIFLKKCATLPVYIVPCILPRLPILLLTRFRNVDNGVWKLQKNVWPQ